MLSNQNQNEALWTLRLPTVFTFNAWALPGTESPCWCTPVRVSVLTGVCEKDDSRSLQGLARNKTKSFPLGSFQKRKKSAIGLQHEFFQAALRHSPAPLLQKEPREQGKPGLTGCGVGQRIVWGMDVDDLRSLVDVLQLLRPAHLHREWIRSAPNGVHEHYKQPEQTIHGGTHL